MRFIKLANAKRIFFCLYQEPVTAVAVNNNFDLVRDCPPAQSNKEEEPSMNNNTVAK